MPRLQHIGRYRTTRRLGGRGDCTLFEARDGADERAVAVKVLDLQDAEAPAAGEALLRFRREAQVLGNLHHPGIVRMLDYGENATHAWLVMELVQGRPLSVAMRAAVVPRILHCMQHLLDALACLHRHGIVHRDLKPANVVVDANGVPVICDLGLAHTEDSLLTQRGELLGTPAYMAPELFQGESVDARSDLFSVAVILYELLSGRLPFAGDSSGDIMLSILQHTPKDVSRLNPDAPAALDSVLHTALAKQREHRFVSAEAFAAALCAALVVPAPR